MTIEVAKEEMDRFVECKYNQIIYPDRYGYGASVMNKVILTDGAREIVREPSEVMECYFEPLKVTILESGKYVPYLWTDQKMINIAVLSGRMNGEELRRDMQMYQRYVVARWE